MLSQGQEARPTLDDYKSRWADFRIQCSNLDAGRRWLRNGYANEDLEATEGELWDRVFAFEDRHAHLSVEHRADLLMVESYRYADL